MKLTDHLQRRGMDVIRGLASTRHRRTAILAAGVVLSCAVMGVSESAWAQNRPGPNRPGPSQPQDQPKADEPPPPPPIDTTPADPPIEVDPLSPTGHSPIHTPPGVRNIIPRETIAVPDRWRIGWPRWDRYGRSAPNDPLLMNNSAGDSPYTLGHPFNPYDRNFLKGDYPIAGDDVFLNGTLISDTLFNLRELPTPSGPSAAASDSFDFFGDGKQQFVSQTLIASVEVFRGNTAFRPVDWLFRATGAVNFNYLDLEEFNGVSIDVRDEDERNDDHAALQELFFEYHLGDVSPMFDFAAVKIGRQLFVSDFRGFIFNDISDGVRFLGNLDANRIQYNLAFFTQNDKDTNSGLNELNWRDQQVVIANLFIQDFIWMGYTTQFSFHWNHDQSDREYDNNGFQVIPDLAGSANLHDIDAYYLGWSGDGHIGRLNVNHAFYYVFGKDDGNPIAGRDVEISAYLAAIELSVDIDWMRPKVSFLYASGDDDPEDGTAEGFDGIVDNPFFAGGPGSFYQSQALRIFGVDLVGARSFYNNLAGTKGEGQSNYVNPGTMIFNVGLDAEITPRLRAAFNANSILFTQTDTLELFLNQNDIDEHVGDELNVNLQYRPFLNNNVIVTVGGSLFFPGEGFEDIYDDDSMLWQFFTGLTLSY